jgi:hypothetical protein
MKEVLLGSVAGCAATVPMTLAMEVLHRRLPPAEQYPLPPRQVTVRAAEAVGVGAPSSDSRQKAATIVAHFGVGTAMGALYGTATRGRRPGPLGGAAFGLAVWAGNYLGLLPALGLLRPATEHPPRRTAIMIAAHLVWGAAAAALLDLATRRDTSGRNPG